MDKLHYSDENDKCYGLAGMAITLAVCDARELLTGMDIDAPAGESVAMAPDFYLRGNPRMPAKYVWTRTLGHFRLAVELVLGNLMCRRYVRDRKGLARETADSLRALVRQDADEHCALETDEAHRLFEEAYDLADRIFRHSGVHDIAHEFAEMIAGRRSLDAVEIFDFLARRGLS